MKTSTSTDARLLPGGQGVILNRPEVDARPKYTCPMCPGVESAGPGICPSCGMALEGAVLPLRETQYICSMHPEIAAKEPGDCPICGMALEPRSVQ
ncbi:MAG: heavy metal-binding domain-containing protein [Alphaproteobacteria bacterium]